MTLMSIRFKAEMSAWWRNTERQFHRLRVASLLSKEAARDKNKERNSPQEGEPRVRRSPHHTELTRGTAVGRSTGTKITAGLRDIKHSVQAEIARMEATGQVLG